MKRGEKAETGPAPAPPAERRAMEAGEKEEEAGEEEKEEGEPGGVEPTHICMPPSARSNAGVCPSTSCSRVRVRG